jgi:hypothetical protein
MKISSILGNFKEKSLIAVTGNHEAFFYKAYRSHIEPIDSLVVEKFKATDREGQRSGNNSTFDGKDATQKMHTRKEIAKRLKELFIKENFKQAYLFLPEYFFRTLPKELPKNIQKKIKSTFKGHFSRKHPFELIEKIKKDSTLAYQ